jgi:hypothetical protein
VKIVLALALVLGGAGTLFGAEPAASGTVTAQLGLGPSSSGALHLQGGADARFGRLFPGSQMPLDWGAAVRVGWQGSGLDAGVLATLRYRWNALSQKWQWLDAWETYAGLGVQVLPELQGVGLFGLAYHPDEHWGVFAEASTLPWPLMVGVLYGF